MRAASTVDLWYESTPLSFVLSLISVFRFSCSCRGKTMGVWVFGLMLPVLVVEGCRACPDTSSFKASISGQTTRVCVASSGCAGTPDYEARCGIGKTKGLSDATKLIECNS